MTVDERIAALMALAEQHETDIQVHTEWPTGLSRNMQALRIRSLQKSSNGNV